MEDEQRPESQWPATKPSRDHYIVRVFPNRDCNICHGGKPVHLHIWGNKRYETVCPTATVEILEFREGKK